MTFCSHGRKFDRQHSAVMGNGRNRRQAFTLIELLVVVTIISILAGLSVAGVSKALGVAGSIKESNAAKSLITAYLTAASDNNGFFIPGFDRTVSTLDLPDGAKISGPTVQRYPYRLAPYFSYDIKGTLLTSNNGKQFKTTDYYQVSVYPSFAINYLFIGGNISADGIVSNERDCLKAAGRGQGAAILVFATAADLSVTGQGENIEGYCKMEPPLGDTPWKTAPWTKNSSPRDYGQIDARHQGKAVCAFSDGSVRKLTVEELRDMRLWSFRAAEIGNPNYTAGSGG